MTSTLANRARMSTETTGTGTITLASGVIGFDTFIGSGIADGATLSYLIEEGNSWEVGRGTYDQTAQTLTRSVLDSSNSGSALNLAGTAQVAVTLLAEDIEDIDTGSIGINGASADATNKLAMNSAASLFNHDGNGHQLKLNKAAAGDTASVLYQTAFSGRAEFGTTGDDDFHVKVSPDGSTWFEAFVADKDTGRIELPNNATGIDVFDVTDSTYGATGDGASDDAAAIQAANDAAEAAGGGIVYYPPGVYRIGTQITCNASNVKHVGSGIGLTTIEVSSNNQSAILFQGSRTTGEANDLASNADQGDTTATVDAGKGANFAAGDWAIILDEATITGTAQKQGELVRVKSVSTDTLTFHAPLRYNYTTGNSAQIQSIQMLTGCGVSGLSARKVMPASSTASLLTALYCDGWEVKDIEVYDNAQQGVTLFGCVSHILDINAHDLLSNSGSAYYGYAVCEAGANLGGRVSVNCQRVRHAFTTIQSTSVLPYGVATGTLVTGTAVDTYLSAWDTHEEAQSITFDSCTSRGSGMAGWQLRGKGVQAIGGVSENSIGPGVYIPNSGEDVVVSGVYIDYCNLGTDEDSTDWTNSGGILDNGSRSSIMGNVIKNSGGPGIEFASSYEDAYVANCRIIDPCRVTTTVKNGISNLQTASTSLHIDGCNITCSDTRMDYGVRITSSNCDAMISGVRVSGEQVEKISRQDEQLAWGNAAAGPLSFGPQSALTIASGAIDIRQVESGFIGVDGEGATTDDLDTITGGYDGQLVALRRSAGNTITIKHATGNILTSTGSDVDIDSATDLFLLVYRPSNWIMVKVS